MLNKDLLTKPGEHLQVMMIDGRQVELALTVPKNLSSNRFGLLAHPHPLHDGTMNNKVVTTVARALRDEGIPSIRFNFRGVGQSDGEFDRGIGEAQDLAKLGSIIRESFEVSDIISAGFSFGAYVSYRAYQALSPQLMISIAPAVNHGDFLEFGVPDFPWQVIAADKDEIVPISDIKQWHQQLNPAPSLKIFEDCGHFFHGKLVALKQVIVDVTQRV